jgi:hypothetical protein
MNFNKKERVLLWGFPALVFLIHIYSDLFCNYGIFRDEMYYIACSKHLSAGYVDQPPFSIWLLALGRLAIGDSVFALRLFPAVFSAFTVFITGLITKRMGGGITALVISLTSVTFAPILLGMNTIYSMNSIDILFWSAAYYFAIKIFEEDKKSDWIIMGVILGLGTLNKISMLWFIAGFVAALVLSEKREKLFTRDFLIMTGISFLIFLPYIIWNLNNNFAILEFMHNAIAHKYSGITRIDFIKGQILLNGPAALPVWIAGLYFFLFTPYGKKFRYLGIIFTVTFLILLLNGKSKSEYLAVAYSALFAGGGVFLESQAKNITWKSFNYLIIVLIWITGIFLIPLALPVLPVESFIRYQEIVGQKPSSVEGKKVSELPQFYADMHGWEELAAEVSKVYKSLPSDEQKKCVVFCNNYGEAGAVEYFASKYELPPAISFHNNYWIWCADVKPLATVIVMGNTKKSYERLFEQVDSAGLAVSKYALPYENNLALFIGHNMKISFDSLRLRNKNFE